MRIVTDQAPATAEAGRELEETVRAILDEVRREGDAAVLRLTARFDSAELGPDELRVDDRELEASVGVLEPAVLDGLRMAVANVKAVARAQLREPLSMSLDQGQLVEIAELPVRRAGVYAPGGRAGYPSSVLMCAATAWAAGVEEVAVCAPPGPGGRAHPVILAACVLCEVFEVYRMGGAQAVGALAYGTESVPAVDVVVGPGNAYVREAKRQVAGVVGIDGLAGPSELALVATAGADPELAALDLLAQAEHGEDSVLTLVSPDAALREDVVDAVARLATSRPSATDAELRVVAAESPREAVRLADELAPEHLQLMGEEAEALADRVRSAGCLFVGRDAATAFGDYVAGSNHVLPTGGAARFGSALSPGTFRRRMARVSLPEGAGRGQAGGGALGERHASHATSEGAG